VFCIWRPRPQVRSGTRERDGPQWLPADVSIRGSVSGPMVTAACNPNTISATGTDEGQSATLVKSSLCLLRADPSEAGDADRSFTVECPSAWSAGFDGRASGCYQHLLDFCIRIGRVKRAPNRTKRCAEPFVEVRQDGPIGTFLRMHQYLPSIHSPREFTPRSGAAQLRRGES
jgi:hypothetical protein